MVLISYVVLRSGPTNNPGWGADSHLDASDGPDRPRFFAALRMTSVKYMWSDYQARASGLLDAANIVTLTSAAANRSTICPN